MQGNMRVLHAEDNDGMRVLMKEWATTRYSEIDLDVVPDGKSAYQHSLDNSYDYIITDCSMPRMDGIELVEKLDEEGYQIPVLFYTSKMGLEGRVDARHSIVEAVFNKNEYQCRDILEYVVEELATA